MKDKLLKLSIGALVFSPIPVFAATHTPPPSAQCQGAAAVGATCDKSALTTPLDNVINTIFFIAGTIAVIVLLVGGIGYIASTGDATRITKAKNTILYAIVGLIVVILARAIVAFVVGRVG